MLTTLRQVMANCESRYLINSPLLILYFSLSLTPNKGDACASYFGRPCLIPGTCGIGPAGIGPGGFYPDAPFRALQSVLGGNIRMDGKLKDGRSSSPMHSSRGAGKPSTVTSQDLACSAWDDTCHWHVGPGKLEWYRGSGTPDLFRLKLSTGSAAAPNPPFAIAATNQALPASESALLVSDPLPCQASDGEVTFMYWTSPQVRVSVCTKKRSSESYDYCSPPITGGDPGPAVVRIAGPISEPFEITITADNFVFNDGRFTGGFAIIDDLQYKGEMCQQLQPENDNIVDERKKSFLGPLDPADQVSVLPAKQNDSEVCQLIKCNFGEGQCMDFVVQSDFKVQKGSVGNAITGIRGDASSSPFNASGEYAYAVGPIDIARYTLPSFTLNEARILRFAYYRASASTKLKVVVARPGDDRDEVIFQAPDTDTYKRRWVHEPIPLSAGKYDKVSFEAPVLKNNTYVGIDEIKLTDVEDHPLC